MVDTESISMQLIAAAGDAKGCAFEALQEANDGNFDKAEELLNQAQDLIRELLVLYKRVDALEKEVKELKEGK